MKFESNKDIIKAVGKWIVTLEGAEWTKMCSKAKQSSISQLSIPGFRKGKVPSNLIGKYINDAKILGEAQRMAIKPAYNFAIDQKSDLKPFTSPIPSILRLSKEMCKIEFSFDLAPEVEVKKYKGFSELEKNSFKPSKAILDTELNKYRDRFAVFIDKSNNTVEKGDSVKFDFEGFVDDKAFPNGSASDFTLEIGSNNFIPGFEDKMIGIKKDESKTIEVRFPKEYHVEDLQDKLASFKLEIKEIKGKELPKMDNEFVKDLNLPGISDIESLNNFIKDTVKEKMEIEEKNRFADTLFRAIVKDSKIIIPETIIKKDVKKLKIEFEQKLQAQQMDMKTYKKKSRLSDKDIEESLFNDAKERIENGIIIDQIQTKENIKISESDIGKEYEKLAKKFNIEVSKLKDGLFETKAIKDMLIQKKVLTFLYEENGNK